MRLLQKVEKEVRLLQLRAKELLLQKEHQLLQRQRNRRREHHQRGATTLDDPQPKVIAPKVDERIRPEDCRVGGVAAGAACDGAERAVAHEGGQLREAHAEVRAHGAGADEAATYRYSFDTPAQLRMVVSRTRPAAEAVSVSEAIGAELVGMGSAGAKAMAVVRGEAEIYLHTGGQYEWDSAAPAAVALAHGLHASRIDGSPLTYNNRDTYMPDLLICRPEWAERVLAEVAKL